MIEKTDHCFSDNMHSPGVMQRNNTLLFCFKWGREVLTNDLQHMFSKWVNMFEIFRTNQSVNSRLYKMDRNINVYKVTMELENSVGEIEERLMPPKKRYR